jgi:hypothetical protein
MVAKKLDLVSLLCLKFKSGKHEKTSAIETCMAKLLMLSVTMNKGTVGLSAELLT